MTRREALMLAVPAFVPLQFPSFVYRNYPACLPDYLASLSAASREKRLRDLAKLTSKEAVQRRQQWVRQSLLRLTGELPEKTELNPQKLGSFQRDGYRVEKVVYESRPKYYVSANLYIPAGNGPFPGVLFELGHAANGKAYHSYQFACQGMVKLGFVVLSFDPMGQGERIYYPDATGIQSRLEDVDEEHSAPGRQMLLVGESCTQYQLWDAIRSLDYLASHPLVDPKRLASTGQSGGATISMLLGAVDDRLAAIAEFSGNTENFACKNFLPPGSTDDAEQNLVGAGPLGLDRWDLFYPFAPKPLLVSISDKDSFGTYSPNYVSDSTEEFQRLANVYQVLGARPHFLGTDTALPHGLSYDSRLQLYNWLRLHLQQQHEPLSEEPTVEAEPDKNLWVSESGNLVKSLGGETPFSLLKQRFHSLKAAAPVSLDHLLGLEQPLAAAPKVLKKVPSLRKVSIEALDFGVSAKVGIPAWLFRSERAAEDAPVLLLLQPHGRNSTWHEEDLSPTLAGKGVLVCAADVRGIGDLAPQFSRGNPAYVRSHQDSENYAWGSMILGRPLVGQRTCDILAIIRGLRKLDGSRRIVVAALGELTAPALFAAALEPSVSALYLAGGLSSYASIVETEDYRQPFANFVPGILEHTDLPEIVAKLAPRKVVLAGPVGGDGHPLKIESAKQLYGAAVASGHLNIIEGTNWSAAALEEFASRPANL